VCPRSAVTMPRMTPPRRFPVILPVNRDISPCRSPTRPMTAASANSPRGNTHDASTAMRHTSTSLRHPSTSTGQGPTTGPRSATQIQGNAADVHTRAQQEFRRSRRPVHRTCYGTLQVNGWVARVRRAPCPVGPVRVCVPGPGCSTGRRGKRSAASISGGAVIVFGRRRCRQRRVPATGGLGFRSAGPDDYGSGPVDLEALGTRLAPRGVPPGSSSHSTRSKGLCKERISIVMIVGDPL
jgi:hypothetical protein